jgi:hypothetical protein
MSLRNGRPSGRGTIEAKRQRRLDPTRPKMKHVSVISRLQTVVATKALEQHERFDRAFKGNRPNANPHASQARRLEKSRWLGR